jgi:quercetin dioxygenase-like cupin family protein
MAKTTRAKSYTQEQKYDLNQFVKFLPGDRTKSDVFRSKHVNIVVICLDDGYEIAPHHEPYDVFFYVILGSGVFTAGEKKWEAKSGTMVFAPAGIRGIKCIERLTILGIQEPH